MNINRKDLVASLATLLASAAILALFIFLTGCATLPTIRPADLPAFVKTGPTVVMFSKDLCPPCDTQEAILADLVKEFPTIRFAKVKAYNALILPTDANMVEYYSLKWTPTTVFQVDGREVGRWITLHGRGQVWPVLQAFATGYLECTPNGCRVRPVTRDEGP